MNDRKYFPTAILIKKKEKKRLDYRLNNDFVTDRIYKSKFFKMRDVLNISQNIDILKKMVDYRQNDHYKIYIDDFNIKDSLQVKF
jgi:cupin superfamily acireductone dioxygenase involved in methionine salvage